MRYKGPKFVSSLTPIERLVCLLGILSLGFSFYATSVGFYNSLYDFHGFRQAQTAISADSMLHGGSFFHYETPVFGPPWSLPFEFPLYQGIVAGLAKILSTPLDQTGRAVSILFYYLCFFPLSSILLRIGLRGTQIIPALSLFAVSPLYVFVSRLFMIESTALFFSLMYVDQMFRLVTGNTQLRYRYMYAAAIFGGIAGMVKVTTFAPYFILGTAWVGWTIWRNRVTRQPSNAVLTAVVLLCVVLPVAATWSWTKFADSVKEQNPFGAFLTSNMLRAWTFGPFAERLHPRIYLRLIVAVGNQAGSVWAVVIVLSVYIWLCRKWDAMAVSGLLLYACTILIFFNLHVVHEYYPYSNAVFLLVAIGVLITAVLKLSGFRGWIGVALLVLQLAACTVRYFDQFYPIQIKNAEGWPAAAALIERTTDPRGAIVILGLDWSPELPYQSHRRAIMNTSLGRAPESWSLDPLKHSIANQGEENVTAVVACGQARYGDFLVPTLKDIGFGSSTNFHEDGCDIYERGSVAGNRSSK